MGLLHKQDMAFGDLQINNILYVPSGAEGHVVLVDFDWAGKDGESRYPATLNPVNAWHDGVMAYGIMEKRHDLWQLEQLKDLCTNSDT